MGQHKTNPNSILKAQGKLKPLPKESIIKLSQLSMQEIATLVMLRASMRQRQRDKERAHEPE